MEPDSTSAGPSDLAAASDVGATRESGFDVATRDFDAVDEANVDANADTIGEFDATRETGPTKPCFCLLPRMCLLFLPPCSCSLSRLCLLVCLCEAEVEIVDDGETDVDASFEFIILQSDGTPKCGCVCLDNAGLVM